MSEIITNRLKKSIDKEIIAILHNGFRFQGILKNFDERFIEIFDFRLQGYKILEIRDISDLSILEGKKNASDR